jgi:hypothetical protein
MNGSREIMQRSMQWDSDGDFGSMYGLLYIAVDLSL